MATEMIQQRTFMWDEIPESVVFKPWVCLIEGMPGVGKSHLSLSFPEPIFQLDTENRGEVVASKFAGTKAVYRKKCQGLADIRTAIKEGIFYKFTTGTIVIDSASDLQKYAEAEWLYENQKKKVFPQVLWSDVFQKIDNLVAAIRNRGYYLVLTARLKDEYVGEGDNRTRTGSLVMEGYKRLPYLSDIHLRLTGGGEAQVLKNGFRITAAERVHPMTNISFDSIMEELIGGIVAEELEKVKTPSPPTKASKTNLSVKIREKTSSPLGEDPNNEKRLALSTEISEVYSWGKSKGLDDDTMKELLRGARDGADSTKGMTYKELLEWHSRIVERLEEKAV